MEVEVFNQNLTGHRTHLGKGAISLRFFIAVSKGKEFTDMKVPLTFEGKQKGFVMMKGHLEAGEEVQELQVVKEEDKKGKISTDKGTNNQATVPTAKLDIAIQKPYQGPAKSLSLFLSGLEVKELVDTGRMLDKQDPMLQIKFGDQTFSTERYVGFTSYFIFYHNFISE
jgi:hypothetical protein